ncbi:MAG: 6-phosphofructokinase [Deltaproteobacteria bacterium]|jgi:6-phosphofructokinase 1|nr:6-phosphofructokinase [Deltaproteobacteria bacterium]
MATIGILVGGGPAPGINGVIGAAAILGRRHGARVVGILEGFRWLMEGRSDHVVDLHIGTVSRIHLLGGSILRTSRANPTRDPEDLRRTVQTLREIGVDHLVTIGGDDTCSSAMRVAEAAGDALRVAHVPKTIDNDLPLPEGTPTFGFETARETGTQVLNHLMEDARTTGRWYVAVMMGRTAGHLTLGAAKAAGATLAIVAEEFPEGPIRLADIERTIEAAIAKRLVLGRPYGVAVVAEGIGERLHPDDLARLPDLPRDEHGHPRLAELPLGRLLAGGVARGLAELGIPMTLVAKDIGYELRCVAPNAFDAEYTRDLGAGAVRALLGGTRSVMITREGNAIRPVPLGEVLDPSSGRARVRMLDTDSPSYALARWLQVRLEPEDLDDPELAALLTRATGLELEDLRGRWSHLEKH